jgi:adenosine kinase
VQSLRRSTRFPSTPQLPRDSIQELPRAILRRRFRARRRARRTFLAHLDYAWITTLHTNADAQDAPSVVLSASIAFDYIMSFPGSFGDHILPEKSTVLSVSFLVDSLRRQRGGVAGNIAYNLALLGVRSALYSGVGMDFNTYRSAFEELGIDLTNVIEIPNELTASAFMMADLRDNQIAAFYPGASAHAGGLSMLEGAAKAKFGLVGAAAPDAMRRHAEEIAAAGCKLIYDPSQQIVALPADDLNAGIKDAWAFVSNDYEYAMLEQKIGRNVDQLTEEVELLVITYGEIGSELRRNGLVTKVMATKVEKVSDPTGAGDAYRAGLIKGLLLGDDLQVAGQMASVVAAYAIEQHGTQEHSFTPEAFVERFNLNYPESAGAITAGQLRLPIPVVR